MFMADKEPFLSSVDVRWDKNKVLLVSSFGRKEITRKEADEIENLIEFEAAQLLPKESHWVVTFTDNTDDGRCTRVWFRELYPMHCRPTRRWQV